MFTGIIKDQGSLESITDLGSNKGLYIKTSLEKKHFFIGNSISVNGVCLTVEEFDNRLFKVTVVQESLDKSTFSDLNEGASLNLEPSLTLETAIAGHFVSGHVDGIAEILKSGEDFKIRIAPEFVKFCPTKGSVCLNGVSLTIAEQNDDVLRIALIPETLKSTNLGQLKPGDYINMEIDLLARYLNQLQK